MQIDNDSKVFLHVQSICDNLIFFSNVFFLIKCAPFFLKIEEGLNIDDYKNKST
jgi:hypothetical protein